MAYATTRNQRAVRPVRGDAPETRKTGRSPNAPAVYPKLQFVPKPFVFSQIKAIQPTLDQLKTCARHLQHLLKNDRLDTEDARRIQRNLDSVQTRIKAA